MNFIIGFKKLFLNDVLSSSKNNTRLFENSLNYNFDTNKNLVEKIIKDAQVFCDSGQSNSRHTITRHTISFYNSLTSNKNKFDLALDNSNQNRISSFSISVYKNILYKMIKYKMLDPNIYKLSIILLENFMQKQPYLKNKNLNNFINLFTISICISNKFIEDNPYTNDSYSELISMNIYLFNKLELYFLSVIQFNIPVFYYEN
jgi:hypothetical protein